MRRLGLGIAAVILAATMTVAGITTSATAGDGKGGGNKCGKKKAGKSGDGKGTGKCKKKKKKQQPTTVPAPVPTTPSTTARLSVDPISVDFGEDLNVHHGSECLTIDDNDCPDQVFTVTNTGNAASGGSAASIATIAQPDGRPAFKILGNGCGGALAPGGSCSLTVTFSPEDGGEFSARLDVTGSPGGTTSAALSGVAD